jgi:hypothetical protein
MLGIKCFCLVLSCTLFEIHTTEGKKVQAELTQWDSDRLVVRLPDSSATFDLEQLSRIENIAPRSPQDKSGTESMVEFTDGSLTPAAQMLVKKNVCTFKRHDGKSMECDLRRLRSIRYCQSRSRDQAWRELIATEFSGDAIVLRQGETGVDYLEGKITEISEGQVSFDLDGELVNVPREKLEGVIVYRSTDDRPTSAAFVMSLRDGSRWNLAGARLDGDTLVAESAGGLTLSVDLNEVFEVNFSTSNTRYLEELTPEAVELTPAFQPVGEISLVRSMLWSPVMNRARYGGPLSVRLDDTKRSQPAEHGLSLHSRTRLIYRLDDRYRELRGTAGIAPEVTAGGTVRLVIRAGSATLLDTPVSRTSPPLDIALSLPESSRLEIIVDYEDGSDLGDLIHLCNLRLVK